MDCRSGQRDGRPCVEFSWEGNDESDPASGRGWAALEEDGSLRGHIYFHLGDDSGFRAVRAEDGRSPRRRATRRGEVSSADRCGRPRGPVGWLQLAVAVVVTAWPASPAPVVAARVPTTVSASLPGRRSPAIRVARAGSRRQRGRARGRGAVGACGHSHRCRRGPRGGCSPAVRNASNLERRQGLLEATAVGDVARWCSPQSCIGSAAIVAGQWVRKGFSTRTPA
jgi:hypothetical protein